MDKAAASFEDLPIFGTLGPDQLLDFKFWNDPLDKFAKATGLTVSLWSADGVLYSGPHVFSPLGKCLKRAGFWDPGSLGFQFEKALVTEVISRPGVKHDQALQSLGVTALPATLGSNVVGVFVVGWLPEDFSNPVSCDHIAKLAGVKSLDLWHIMRMQQPMTEVKRSHYCEMLEALGNALFLRIEKQFFDWRQAQILRILHESSMALTVADSISEVTEITLSATKSLIFASHVSVKIFAHSAFSEQHAAFSDDAHKQVSAETRFQIPIESATHANLGVIEVRSPRLSGLDVDIIPAEMDALASQVAVTIQKIHVRLDLERERVALEEANLKLRQMARLKDEFLATLSHELRTPMNSILGWSQLLRDHDLDQTEIPEAMAAIERNARIQSRLIEDLLDVSRIISGKMILNRELIDAAEIMNAALETVRPAADAKKIKLHSHLPEHPMMLKGDSARIQQVFWNLLSNAVKFSPENGEVTVLMKPAGAYFEVEVLDNGKGIPENFLPHIFDRFSQADGSNSRAHGGLGLGLAIVRHIVELHGGSVAAETRGDSKGAKFSILFPAGSTDLELDTALEVVTAEPSLPGAKRALEGLKILAIDDEPDSLRLIRFVLEKSGASVVTADSAASAFELLINAQPDLIVSDLSMANENGFELIRRIRMLPPDQGGTTPAFALSALTSDNEKTFALESGFQRHFAKPLNPKAIVEAISGFAKFH